MALQTPSRPEPREPITQTGLSPRLSDQDPDSLLDARNPIPDKYLDKRHYLVSWRNKLK
ncbi:unnamed protein product [Dovyalis caffra]|uniref:Uncharacterized protein n=1 Tax=Dovyalis caffra TaxID=77055 RepID=A0AAV1QLH3_9ROSI|nr:unnamed protein product [Dovyalis caffra]